MKTNIAILLLAVCGGCYEPEEQSVRRRVHQEITFSNCVGKTISRMVSTNGDTRIIIFLDGARPLIIDSYKYPMRMDLSD